MLISSESSTSRSAIQSKTSRRCSAIGDVGREQEEFPLAEFLGQLVAGALEHGFVACDEQHVRAERGQLARAGETDAFAGAADQGDLAIQAPA